MTSQKQHQPSIPVDDTLVDIDGRTYYAVRDVARMPPFLMSIVSDGDCWMYVSSSGGITAGRRDMSGALFPYETDDRLHNLGGLNGAATAIRVTGFHPDETWRPITDHGRRSRSRTIYKSVVGDSVIHEEHDTQTGLTFRSSWATSDHHGFIRSVTLVNESPDRRRIAIVDGMRNILPHGLEPSIYLRMGNLANAYKRGELIDSDLRLATYSLESRLTDRSDPAQALRTTIAWSVGLEEASVSLHPDTLRRFEMGYGESESSLVTGLPGAYFLKAELELQPGDSRTWYMVADVALDQPAVAAVTHRLRSLPDPARVLRDAARRTSQSLIEMMGRADGLQCTQNRVATAHHFSNVTYNVMRGGIPLDGYRMKADDFHGYLERRNSHVAVRHRDLLQASEIEIDRGALLARAEATGDSDLIRLVREYLPFSFSRRHGDPSRPWNTFSIRVTDADGSPVQYYEGNWRDIFQNWEALCASYPEYVPDIVSVFLNASTADGFNPYRITSHGIDWEVPDPDDFWSNIGYWGDHQIVYLLRLLQASDRYMPGAMPRLLLDARYAYADVPYRIVPYEQLLTDPKSTIEYDEEAARVVDERVATVGADGKLVWVNGAVYHVTLAEKLMVPALAKLSNYVPGGGIWMNTQRPEWNDANNALVGFGLSMVTLYQLRAYLDHLRGLLRGSDIEQIDMSTEVKQWMRDVADALSSSSIRPAAFSEDRDRKRVLDALGSAYSKYRHRYYRGGFSGTSPMSLNEMTTLCDIAIDHLDATIEDGKRSDGLVDSYNLIAFTEDGASATVEHLGEMLEGQVAVIESGVLEPDECVDIVDALYASTMYRPDQDSFMLYPARTLPPFLERNIMSRTTVDQIPLLSELLERNDSSIVEQDVDGRIRFNADLSTTEDLAARLEVLAASDDLSELIARHGDAVTRAYEQVFGHHTYTGRSGSMYGYEGVGSVYWHMVAKLLVALHDCALRSVASGASPETRGRIAHAYWRVRSGMGFNKTPLEHGAIPIEPYSHTPSHSGAQQPGMTGLVKEEILVRPAELGTIIEDGAIRFDTSLLRASEFLDTPRTWRTLDTALTWLTNELPSHSLGLTICQVPIIVVADQHEEHIEVDLANGTTKRLDGRSLGSDLSSMVFGRTGEITRVRAHLNPFT